MATKKTSSTTAPAPSAPSSTAPVSTPTAKPTPSVSSSSAPVDPAAYLPSPRRKKATARAPSGRTTSPAAENAGASTAALATKLRRCTEAKEVKVPEERGIAVRLKTRQFEIPMLVHVPDDDDGLVVFDVYPFRFVGIDARATDWLALVRLAGSSYVQLRIDQDLGDKDVLVYSFHMPLKSLTDDVTATTVTTLAAFAEDNYDDVMAATGLVETAVSTG